VYPIIQFAGFSLPAFGLALALGFVGMHVVLYRVAKRSNYPASHLHTLTLIAFAAGSIGSRLTHIILNGESLLHFFQLSEGTLYYGFLLGVVAGLFIYAVTLSNGRDIWREIDLLVPAWLVMQLAGRIGCFLAGCCYGTPTDLPWSVTYTSPISDAPLGVPLHPTQLYEAGIALFLIVVSLPRKKVYPSGVIFLRGFILYSISRFLLEFLRADPRGTLIGLSTSQGLAVLLAPIALIVLISRYFTSLHKPQIVS
jgi:phosphatidylglycerol---prolipoprotein diacylglyceryl transferase